MHIELSFELGPLDPQIAEEACWACGACALTFLDARDDAILEPAPGEFRLWPRTHLRCLFEAGCDAAAVRRTLADALGLDPSSIEAREVVDRVWEREWLEHFHAMRFGRRVWVCPHHERVSASDAVVVALDPGLAFGTGSHPSTALCLRWLDAHFCGSAAPAEHSARVIDYGCGSGVLAIAAAKLGAHDVHAFDIDPQALIAARDNAAANAVAGRIRLHEQPETLPGSADVLLANILSGPLCALAPRFASLVRARGEVVLAGLMQHEVGDVTDAYAPCFDVAPFGELEGWVGLTGLRR
jgi:ribosomal protein L11 methyltransferase